jgi:hypothetical protein
MDIEDDVITNLKARVSRKRKRFKRRQKEKHSFLLDQACKEIEKGKLE